MNPISVSSVDSMLMRIAAERARARSLNQEMPRIRSIVRAYQEGGGITLNTGKEFPRISWEDNWPSESSTPKPQRSGPLPPRGPEFDLMSTMNEYKALLSDQKLLAQILRAEVESACEQARKGLLPPDIRAITQRVAVEVCDRELTVGTEEEKRDYRKQAISFLAEHVTENLPLLLSRLLEALQDKSAPKESLGVSTLQALFESLDAQFTRMDDRDIAIAEKGADQGNEEDILRKGDLDHAFRITRTVKDRAKDAAGEDAQEALPGLGSEGGSAWGVLLGRGSKGRWLWFVIVESVWLLNTAPQWRKHRGKRGVGVPVSQLRNLYSTPLGAAARRGELEAGNRARILDPKTGRPTAIICSVHNLADAFRTGEKLLSVNAMRGVWFLISEAHRRRLAEVQDPYCIRFPTGWKGFGEAIGAPHPKQRAQLRQSFIDLGKVRFTAGEREFTLVMVSEPVSRRKGELRIQISNELLDPADKNRRERMAFLPPEAPKPIGSRKNHGKQLLLWLSACAKFVDLYTAAKPMTLDDWFDCATDVGLDETTAMKFLDSLRGEQQLLENVSGGGFVFADAAVRMALEEGAQRSREASRRARRKRRPRSRK